MLINPYSFGSSQLSAIDILTAAGLTTSLEFCLDAGEALSLPASSTKWLDRSGNGQDFFRGTSASSQSTDPSINGTAGGLSSAEYLSFDGGDRLTYDTSNETWMNAIYKDSAAFTFAFWLFYKTTADSQRLASTSNLASEIGFKLYISDADSLNLNVNNGTGDEVVFPVSAGEDLDVDAWNFVALSADESAGAFRWQTNAVQETDTNSYDSPSSSNATNTITLGADDDGSQPLGSGSRMGVVFC